MEEKRYENYEIMLLEVETLKTELRNAMQSLNMDLDYINDLVLYGCWGDDNLKQIDGEKDSLLEKAYILLMGKFYDNNTNDSGVIGHRGHKAVMIDNSIRNNYYSLIKEITDKLNDDYFTEEDILTHPRKTYLKNIIEVCTNRMYNYRNTIENESQNNEYTIIRNFLIKFLSIDKQEINQIKRDREIFLKVIQSKDYEIFKLLLPNHTNINAQSSERSWRSSKIYYGPTALIEASRVDQLEMVKHILKMPSINVNVISGSSNWYALAYAVHNNNVEIVKELLKNPDIKPNLKFENNRYINITPLYMALYENKMDIARELLKHPKINPFLDVNNHNYNYEDIIRNNLLKPENFDVFKSIINNKKKSTNKSYFLNTMLNAAVSSNSLDAFKELIKIPDVYNQINVHGMFYNNCINNNCPIEMVKILLEHPNSNLRSDILLSILNRINNVKIIQALLSHPNIDDPNVKDYNGNTALILASDWDHLQVVEELLKHPKIDPNVQNKDGNTALIWASRKGHSQVVQALLSHAQTDPNIQTANGSTALHLATPKESEKHLQVVQELLKHPKINPNVQNVDGSTALMGATAYGSPEIVEELLKHPLIDVTIKTDKGSNAWDFARQEIRDKFSQLNIKLNIIEEMKEFSESLSKEQKERFILLLQKVEKEM